MYRRQWIGFVFMVIFMLWYCIEKNGIVKQIYGTCDIGYIVTA